MYYDGTYEEELKVLHRKRLIKPLTDKEIEDPKAYDQIVGHWQERWSEETDNQKRNMYQNMIQMFYEDNEKLL